MIHSTVEIESKSSEYFVDILPCVYPRALFELYLADKFPRDMKTRNRHLVKRAPAASPQYCNR